jgi:glycosyltransferase involved in cell wall biosynthesis
VNIWLVNHYALPPDKAGGTRHYSLAKELSRKGHQVTIIASSVDYFTQSEDRLVKGETSKFEVVDGVSFVWLRTPTYSGNTLARMHNMASFAYSVWTQKGLRKLGKPDVILGSTPHLFAALAAERLASRLTVPFVLEVRDIWPQSLVDLGNISPNHPFILLLATIERYLYRRADKIITLLPGAHQHIANVGGEPSKVVWLPNGVDLSLVPNHDKLPNASPNNSDKPLRIMYAGAHGLANGLDVVLEAATLLLKRNEKRIRFTLVGAGPEKDKLVEMARERQLSNVEFCSPLAKRDIHSFMQQADAFLLILKDSPVFRWGISPNKMFDYLAVERPVLFGVNTPFNPVADANAGITFEPENPEALVRAVETLLTLTATERQDMGLRGRKYVEENHSFTKLADRLEGVLQEVVMNH